MGRRVERKAITERMKIDAFLDMTLIRCMECGTGISPGEAIDWDHRQALCHDGQHSYKNIRPVHRECHKGKTKRDIQANAKVKRITGETGTRADKFAVAKKPLDEPHERQRRYGNTTFRSTPR